MSRIADPALWEILTQGKGAAEASLRGEVHREETQPSYFTFSSDSNYVFNNARSHLPFDFETYIKSAV
ncbi:MAG TPA: hypothetical protein DDZ81_15400 [Acetobacteraceae bacterium]|nr:hypothetical protein [Acetobacteraceae bacterium]